MPLKTSDFDYPLDSSLIAQHPAERRDESRLLVLRRSDGRIADHVFSELPSLLRGGDLLVVNDTQVLPARFYCRRASGGRIEGLFCRELSAGRWEVLLRGAGRCRSGEDLALQGRAGASVRIAERIGEGRFVVSVSPLVEAGELLRIVGQMPLPPYIRREGSECEQRDRQRYQTIYASKPGAVAAPTAGLHFTDSTLRELARNAIRAVSVTLHVGPGTFAPVKCADPSRHRMHAEWYELSAETAGALNAARREGRRIVAVGTTSVRVLETVAAGGGEFAAASGWTEIFIRPPAVFRAVGALVTNFHLPRSSLLMLVAAFCSPGDEKGLELVRSAYAYAAERRYRFFSYGDAMLIE